MQTESTRLTLSRGAVKVTAESVYDFDPDLSWIGCFTDQRRANPSLPLYSRQRDAIRMPNSDLWRNRRGQITEAPEDSPYTREYQYIALEDSESGTKIAFADADRMEAYERQEWGMLGIVATVTVDGCVIGSASLWGIESDSGSAYIRSNAREVAAEAIADAREWFTNRAV